MPANEPFLVYRDRIGVRSELAFLRRQYIGFRRLSPIWIGRTLLADAFLVGDTVLRLAGDGPLGSAQRFLFRHLGQSPALDAAAGVSVLHAQFARGGALALPLVHRFGLRMAVTLHGGDISKQKNWQGTVLARRWDALVSETKCFVCVSTAVAEIAARRGIPAGKLTVLPIGVEVPADKPNEQRVSFLFVGRFVEKKGVVVLADAVRRLRAAGDQTALVCVGDGPLRPVLETLAREVPGITLTGWLSPDAVRVHMTRGIALLVPSIIAAGGDTEGLPSVIPEAMAQGCPIIGANQGGIAEAVGDERDGLLVPTGDPVALALAMRRLATNPRLRDDLGATGRTTVATKLNARIQSQRLETLLLSL